MWFLGFEAWSEGRADEGAAADAGRSFGIVLARMLTAALIMAAVPGFLMLDPGHEALIVAFCLLALLPLLVVSDLRRRAADIDAILVMVALTTTALLAAAAAKGVAPLAVLLVVVAGIAEAGILARGRAWRRIGGIWAAGALGATILWVVAGRFVPAPVWCNLLLVAAALSHMAVIAWGLRRRHLSGDGATRQVAAHALLLSEVVDDAVVLVDARAGVLSASPNVLRLFGHESADLLGRGLLNLVLVSDRPAVMQALHAAAAGQRPAPLRCRLRDGRVTTQEGAQEGSTLQPRFRWIEFSARPSPSPGEAAVAVLRDAEMLVAAEARQAAAEEAAQRARASQAVFLSRANHELRTPLNAIIGFSDMLANPAIKIDPASAADYARLINGAGYDLLRMVTAMMDLTRLDAGLYDYRPEPIAVATLVETGLSAALAELEADRLNVAPDIAPDLGDILADARAVQRIITQILSHAAKAANPDQPIALVARPHGTGVRLTIRFASRELSAGKTRPAAQVGAAGERSQGDLGLGLALGHRLAALHGGALSLEDRRDFMQAHLDLPADGTCDRSSDEQSQGSSPRNTIVLAAYRASPPPEEVRRRA